MADQKNREIEWRKGYGERLHDLKEVMDIRKEWLAKYIARLEKGEASANEGGAGALASMTSGSNNEEKTWNFFAEKGFTNAGAAGIMGNLEQESGIDPTKKQYGGGPGRGLCQWEKGARWDTLVAWAKEQGRDEWDINTQLDFMWKELTTPGDYSKYLLDKNYGGIEALRSTDDYKWAVRAFEDSFERAGKPNYPQRYEYAEEFLKKYGQGGSGSAAQMIEAGGGVTDGKFAVIKGGRVYVPEGDRSDYNNRMSRARRNTNNFTKLGSDKFSNNLAGCTMKVAPEYYPIILLMHEHMKKQGLLSNGRMKINSAFRYTLNGRPDLNAHGWGGAIDIGTNGWDHALSVADLAWNLGMRAVQVGGSSLKRGGGFVHVDIGPAGTYDYGYGVYQGPGSLG